MFNTLYIALQNLFGSYSCSNIYNERLTSLLYDAILPHESKVISTSPHDIAPSIRSNSFSIERVYIVDNDGISPNGVTILVHSIWTGEGEPDSILTSNNIIYDGIAMRVICCCDSGKNRDHIFEDIGFQDCCNLTVSIICQYLGLDMKCISDKYILAGITAKFAMLMYRAYYGPVIINKDTVVSETLFRDSLKQLPIFADIDDKVLLNYLCIIDSHTINDLFDNGLYTLLRKYSINHIELNFLDPAVSKLARKRDEIREKFKDTLLTGNVDELVKEINQIDGSETND